VPVIPDIPEESILNFGDEAFNSWSYVFVNRGTGENYGIEVTLEKFFDNNYYALITGTLYESHYRGCDGIIRNTKFAGNYSLNALLGYEWKLGKRNLLSINGKVSNMGGKRYVPASVQHEGDEYIYDYSRAYSERLPAYFRMDLNANLKINFRKVSLEYFAEAANLTNHKNIWVNITMLPAIRR
jgi:outer membrane receptor protein involved in Fe transport